MEHKIKFPWQVKLAFTVCLILMLACSESVPTAVPASQPSPIPEANAPAPETNTDPCDHPDGYVCVQLSDGSWGMLLAAEAANLSGQYVLEYAASAGAGETAIYSASAGSYTVFAVLIPVTLVFNPNLIQQLAEGPPYMYQNGTLSIYQNGQVISVQLVDQSAVQDTVEGDTSAELRDQCQETQQGCMSTPQPRRALVIGDPEDVYECQLLYVWGITHCDFSDVASVQVISAMTGPYELVIIRAGKDGWRLERISTIRAQFPGAKIIVVSGGYYQQQAMDSGADGYFASGAQHPEEMKQMLQSLGVIP